jgi:transcriptional regulator with XRE-family HTH domain
MNQPQSNQRRNLGAIIRAKRLALGLTPREFADEIGRSELAVAKIEHEGIGLDLALLKRCEQVLQIKLADTLSP